MSPLEQQQQMALLADSTSRAAATADITSSWAAAADINSGAATVDVTSRGAPAVTYFRTKDTRALWGTVTDEELREQSCVISLLLLSWREQTDHADYDNEIVNICEQGLLVEFSVIKPKCNIQVFTQTIHIRDTWIWELKKTKKFNGNACSRLVYSVVALYNMHVTLHEKTKHNALDINLRYRPK